MPFQNRINRIIENMRGEGLDQIIISSIPSIYYLTGIWVHDVGERMLALYLNSDGASRLFINQMFYVALGSYSNYETFSDTDDPIRLLAAHIRPGKIGVDKFWPSHFIIRLMQARPDLEPVIGSGPIDQARMCKDKYEIMRMRESSRKNDEALRRTISGIQEGMTEKELGNLYIRTAEMLSPEGSAFAPNTSFGVNSADLHHANTQSRLKRGDNILLDVGLLHQRYVSDMTRTVFLGEPSDEMKRVYDVILKANDAGRRAIRPGIPMCKFDYAARKVIEDAGYGRYFLHRTGHGIGLECHEFPDNSASSQIIARPGMCFSVEPCISLPGRFGIRIEDIVTVTEDGSETLNQLNREMMIL